MKTYSYYVLFLLVVFCGCSRPTELTSPDGNIKLVFNLNEAGAMTYGVSVLSLPQRMKPGPSLGGRINLSGTIITRWLCA